MVYMTNITSTIMLEGRGNLVQKQGITSLSCDPRPQPSMEELSSLPQNSCREQGVQVGEDEDWRGELLISFFKTLTMSQKNKTQNLFFLVLKFI